MPVRVPLTNSATPGCVGTRMPAGHSGIRAGDPHGTIVAEDVRRASGEQRVGGRRPAGDTSHRRCARDRLRRWRSTVERHRAATANSNGDPFVAPLPPDRHKDSSRPTDAPAEQPQPWDGEQLGNFAQPIGADHGCDVRLLPCPPAGTDTQDFAPAAGPPAAPEHGRPRGFLDLLAGERGHDPWMGPPSTAATMPGPQIAYATAMDAPRLRLAFDYSTDQASEWKGLGTLPAP